MMRRICIICTCLATGLCLFLSQLQAQYAEQSVLRSGTWYKIAITESGIHKLDQTFFNQLGLTNFDPRNLQIYGNGGGMLPQENNAFRHDDLVENAIEVVGEADGRFDAGDQVLFYAQGPHTFQWSESSERFEHSFNLYSDTNYYFIRVGDQPGKRIGPYLELGNASQPLPLTRAYFFHEKDEENIIRSGRSWLGEYFTRGESATRTYSFYTPDVSTNGKIRLTIRTASKASIETNFSVQVNGQNVGSLLLGAVSVSNQYASQYSSRIESFLIDPATLGGKDSVVVTLRYNSNENLNATGYLDWIELDYDQAARIGRTDGWYFSLPSANGMNEEPALMSLSNASAGYRVWDISDPTRAESVPSNLSGSTLQLTVPTKGERRWVAFKEATLQPVAGEQLANQNLHGMTPADYLIIVPDIFRPEAQQLADFHQSHYGRTVALVSPTQIYNEFSSGKQDVSAIRDFIRMQYVQTGGAFPQFVLFFGDGSFVYKNLSPIFTNEGNFVPTYQSRNSWDPIKSYTSDDFFVMLEDDEGYWGEGGNGRPIDTYDLDIPIGRLPVENKEQAQQIVDKILRYALNTTGSDLGAWRSRVVLVADHKDSDRSTHVRQADSYSAQIHGANPCINLEKIYMDNYKFQVSGTGESFPEGVIALREAMDNGSLILNYTGHGSFQAWSNADIFLSADIKKLQNDGRYPAVVTATCEFGRFDDPVKRSGGEEMMMEPEAGAISMYTTVRLVFSYDNEILNDNFYREVFKYDSTAGRMPTMGEIMMRTKNRTYSRSPLNTRNFTLLGDPGLIMNYPGYRADITTINGLPIDPSEPDSFKTLEKVSVQGFIRDGGGQIMEGFSGPMDVTVFDKPTKFTTNRYPFTFSWQKNRIFNGLAQVENGAFNFEFVVPIDVSYEDGAGKISLYAGGEAVDAEGCLTDIYIGGTADNIPPDNKGPEVALYINDSLWQEGGITGPDPYLFAVVEDENGINTVGNGVGHELIAYLDENQDELFILNDFYQSEPNSYKKGYIRYQMEQLEEGPHTLTLRVWDVANNATEAETRFIVASNLEPILDDILFAPNPYNPTSGEPGKVVVAHNLDGKEIEVKLEIVNTTGQTVSEQTARFVATGNRYEGLQWDGVANNGLYIFRITLTDIETGQQVRKAERLVLTR